MNLQQGIMLVSIIVTIGVLVFIIASVIVHYRYRDHPPPIREVSKRRIGWMWIVDDEESHVLQIVPKHPRRSEVQMYDEEQGKDGWLQ